MERACTVIFAHCAHVGYYSYQPTKKSATYQTMWAQHQDETTRTTAIAAALRVNYLLCDFL